MPKLLPRSEITCEAYYLQGWHEIAAQSFGMILLDIICGHDMFGMICWNMRSGQENSDVAGIFVSGNEMDLQSIVCMPTCMHAYIHASKHACMHSCMNAHASTRACIQNKHLKDHEHLNPWPLRRSHWTSDTCRSAIPCGCSPTRLWAAKLGVS